MNILVTGGTGFAGRAILPELIAAGHSLTILVRPGSAAKLPPEQRRFARDGNPLDPASLAEALDGCDAVVHLVGMRREETKRTGLTYEDVDLGSARAMAAAMSACGVRRIVLLSAAAIGNSQYVRCKESAERVVIEGGLDWTIYRPSFVLGPGQQWPRIMEPALALLSLLPGHYGDLARRARYVTREELARSIARSVADGSTIGKIFDVPAIRRTGAPAWKISGVARP